MTGATSLLVVRRPAAGTQTAMAPLALAPLLVLVLAVLPAGPAHAAETTPGGSSALGFPIALVVLAVVATVFALVMRARSKKRDSGS